MFATPINSGFREGADDMDYVSPYLRHPTRTLAEAERDYDHAQVRALIRSLYDAATREAQHGNDSEADRLHKQAGALGRMIARDNREARDGR
jgi:hypothetical protein